MIVHPKAIAGNPCEIGAPMPGTVMEVRVKAGDTVVKGQALMVLTAMKMEMVVQAPCDAVIKEVLATRDMKLAGDDLLVRIDPK